MMDEGVTRISVFVSLLPLPRPVDALTSGDVNPIDQTVPITIPSQFLFPYFFFALHISVGFSPFATGTSFIVIAKGEEARHHHNGLSGQSTPADLLNPSTMTVLDFIHGRSRESAHRSNRKRDCLSSI